MRELKAGVLPTILIVLPLLAMLLKQPDFGSAVMVVMLVFTMLWQRARVLNIWPRPAA